MVKVTASVRSQVIEKYLYRYSLSQIAKEIGISKTTAYNIVQDWNSKVSFLDVEDIRIFLSHLRKSGITIEECVQGYRTIQILKQFGVEDDDELEEWDTKMKK
jgi:transposase-like protein